MRAKRDWASRLAIPLVFVIAHSVLVAMAYREVSHFNYGDKALPGDAWIVLNLVDLPGAFLVRECRLLLWGGRYDYVKYYMEWDIFLMGTLQWLLISFVVRELVHGFIPMKKGPPVLELDTQGQSAT